VAHVFYELTLKGQASDAVCAAFDDLEVARGPGITVLRARLADQAALYGVLARVQGFGLELLDVRLVTQADGEDAPEQ
jgi:hypothetical protein